MKKLLYTALSLFVVCMAIADDYIIRIVNRSGSVISIPTKNIQTVYFDYHNQDSIDQAYADSVRAVFVKDSLYQDSIIKDARMRDSIGRMHTLGYMMDSTAHFSIFAAALHLTGLYDTLNVVSIQTYDYDSYNHRGISGSDLYGPTERRNGFTLFAEPDSVMHQYGINNIQDLIAYANSQYRNAADWYSYPLEKGVSISTDDDYTYRFNALNMFVAYHILKSKMAANELVYEPEMGRNGISSYWNYVNGTAPYDYYETLLPGTIMKIWQPYGTSRKVNTPRTRALFINRWVPFNTLTDEVGTLGSDAMHAGGKPGVSIVREDGYAYNGYYHPLGDMLLYDADVPSKVLHERMRFDFVSMQPEMSNNGFRFMNILEVSHLNSGGDGSRIAFPDDYFDGIRMYDTSSYLRYSVKSAYNAYMSDVLQASSFDFAVKLPTLPTGTYEVRIPYFYSGNLLVQYYLGTSSDAATMQPIGIPVDYSIHIEDPRIGWTNYLEEEDLGIASDKALRNKGYMRGPYSFTDHAERGDVGNNVVGDNRDRNLRYTITGNQAMRMILGRFAFKQGESRWMRVRIANVASVIDPKSTLDYIEFVPVDVVDNETYMEDWY